MAPKSGKSTLQQLMGGTSNVKEAFTFPGMSDIYGKITDEDTNETDENTNTIKPDPKPATKPAPKPAPKVASGSNVIGATPGATKQTSNTSALMEETQNTTTNNILVFVIHVIFAIIIAYIWGILGSNALFLMTRSKNEKEYILPTYRYAPPYCITENKNASYFSYGFPYNLLPRICTNNGLSDVINTEIYDDPTTNSVFSGSSFTNVPSRLPKQTSDIFDINQMEKQDNALSNIARQTKADQEDIQVSQALENQAYPEIQGGKKATKPRGRPKKQKTEGSQSE